MKPYGSVSLELLNVAVLMAGMAIVIGAVMLLIRLDGRREGRL